jgi:diaminopimelate decarboxylase
MRDVALQKAERGDVLAVFTTGAYGYSMASNYNKLPFLPVVMTSQSREKGQHRLVVRRQTYQDLISRDI